MPYHYVVRNVNNEIIGTRKSKGRLYNFAIVEGSPATSVHAYSADYNNAQKRAQDLQQFNHRRGQFKDFWVATIHPVSAEEFKAAKKELAS